MVKRAKSPDTAEDEKYFTVYQPYPLNANWELPSDYIAFSRWIAACIGKDPIHALHYKPSARGMVLIEVDKKYPHNERLLGEHKWQEFLRNPTEEEADRVTQIFHSLYTTGREAQKDGWKRIHVEAPWFKGWSPTTDAEDRSFADEYPPTSWCPTPAEDRTNKPLCRPLPVKVKPPPPKVAPPVPGSASWVTSKTAPPQNTPLAQKNAWNQERKASNNIPSASAWNKPITSPTPLPAQPTPSPSTTAPSVVSPGGARGRSGQKSNDSPATSPTSPTGPPPAFPPGLNIRPTPGQTLPAPPGLKKLQWSDDVDSSASGSGSGSGSDSRSLEDTEKVMSDMFDKKMTISLSPSQDRVLYGTAVDQSPELDSQVIHPWETNIPTFDSMKWSNTDVSPSENLWGDDSSTKSAAQVAQCPYHQHTCKKGVCTWRAKQVKEEERLAALAKKIDEGGKGGRGKGKGGAKTGGWRQNLSSTASDAGDDETDDGFAKVNVRGKGRRGGGR
ncbi:hypothetical protein DXG01_015619 [Tephrocybe rancida]|nr:hypothetical protein DXG01_015619 [Tephrocybe rancida]